MNITLNGNRLDFQLENEKTVGEVLGKIEEACRKEKSTINEVRVNGKAVSAEELDVLFQKDAQDPADIELFTIGGEDIRLYLKELAGSFIENAEALESVPVKMQTGKDGEVLSLIENFSVNLANLYNTVKLFDLAEIPQDLKFGDMPFTEYQKKIAEFLDAAISAFENKDTIEVSDIAEYELAPLVKELGNCLSALA